jgi:hypothetical protein
LGGSGEVDGNWPLDGLWDWGWGWEVVSYKNKGIICNQNTRLILIGNLLFQAIRLRPCFVANSNQN